MPGPQFPLYLLGHKLQVLYPVVPLARRQALGIAVMSYDGHLGFGLLADYDALPGLEAIVRDLRLAIASLTRAAGIPGTGSKKARGAGRTSSAARTNGTKPAARKAAAASPANGAKPRRRAVASVNGRASLGKPPAVQS